MAKKLERIQGFRVVVDPDGTLFLKRQETENLAGKFTDKETFEITVCVHGHPIRAPQEMGGICICGRLLCKECAQLRCHFDGHVLCKDDALSVRGKWICQTHGVFRILGMLLLPE